ncbi:hypothetical protein [Bradyrhizobium sp.]|uniref:hypothetical protein n=1 Tax=Bradyrhizobium sp. TaxID=376 RepID=UPI003C5A9D18
MTDVLGWRCKFGVFGPSTNTIVQPDFDDMRPRGVTNHYSRIFTPNANAVSNESFRASAEVIASNVLEAVRSVMTCAPDYLVMGMSATRGLQSFATNACSAGPGPIPPSRARTRCAPN